MGWYNRLKPIPEAETMLNLFAANFYYYYYFFGTKR